MGKRELEVLGKELLDVRATDGIGLLDLDDLEDLYFSVSDQECEARRWIERTWIDLKRER